MNTKFSWPVLSVCIASAGSVAALMGGVLAAGKPILHAKKRPSASHGAAKHTQAAHARTFSNYRQWTCANPQPMWVPHPQESHSEIADRHGQAGQEFRP